MIQIQIIYDEPEEKELAELYQSRILEEHITSIVPVVVVQRKRRVGERRALHGAPTKSTTPRINSLPKIV